MLILRLVCAHCGTRLSDVERPMKSHQPSGPIDFRQPLADGPADPGYTRDGLVVNYPTLKGVAMVDHRHPGLRSAISRDHTYSLTCRCGRTYELRHERISAKWVEFFDSPDKIVTLAIGRDL